MPTSDNNHQKKRLRFGIDVLQRFGRDGAIIADEMIGERGRTGEPPDFTDILAEVGRRVRSGYVPYGGRGLQD